MPGWAGAAGAAHTAWDNPSIECTACCALCWMHVLPSAPHTTPHHTTHTPDHKVTVHLPAATPTAAPEELVMPKNVPRAPLPVVASLFAPFVWQYGRPDLFDTYAAGIILMQVRGCAADRG